MCFIYLVLLLERLLVLVRAAELVLRRRQRREDVGPLGFVGVVCLRRRRGRRAHARRLDAELLVPVVVGDVVAPALDLVDDASEPFSLSLEICLDPLADGELGLRLRRGRGLRLR